MSSVHSVLRVVAAVAVVVVGMSGGMASAANFEPESFADLAAKVTPAVVAISSSSTSGTLGTAGDNLFKPAPNQHTSKDAKIPVALGSGFIIDPSGYIVTNSHVVDNADTVQVTLEGGRSFPAALIGTDRKTDLALLKVDPPGPLPYVSFGDSDAARVGDRIMAVGNPYGLGGSVTTGIISAVGRDLRTGPFDDFLQIDAPINPGNSGGPSFNLMGEVIGINSAIASPNGGSVGIGFAIPANLAKPIIQALRLHGQVVRGWIGVSAQEITPEIAESLDLDNPGGALLVSVQSGGPAALAGLRRGDAILTFDGHPVGMERELARIVAGEPTGKRVDVLVWRGGSLETLQVTIGYVTDKPQAVSAATTVTPVADEAGSLLRGVQLAALTEGLRRKLALPNGIRGVVILDLPEGSLAARAGLQPADIIEQVEQQDVGKPADVERLIRQAAAKGHSAVLFLVSRGSSEVYLAVTTAKDKLAENPIPYLPSAQRA